VFQLVSWSENGTEKVKLSVFPHFRERERECSEFRRTLIMAVVLLYPSPSKAFYNTDSLCRFKLFCLLFHSQNLNFKCFQNFPPCKCLDAEKWGKMICLGKQERRCVFRNLGSTKHSKTTYS